MKRDQAQRQSRIGLCPAKLCISDTTPADGKTDFYVYVPAKTDILPGAKRVQAGHLIDAPMQKSSGGETQRGYCWRVLSL